jgi:hypothetical protein
MPRDDGVDIHIDDGVATNAAAVDGVDGVEPYLVPLRLLGGFSGCH